jgi:hypothetical protein
MANQSQFGGIVAFLNDAFGLKDRFFPPKPIQEQAAALPSPLVIGLSFWTTRERKWGHFGP